MSDDRVFLDKEQAVSMLDPDSPFIHTVRDSGPCLVGADWSREDILAAIQNRDCELGGTACRAMNHGLVIHTGGPLFVRCRDDIDYSEYEPKE